MTENPFDAPEESDDDSSEIKHYVPWCRLALIRLALIVVAFLCLIKILNEFS